MAGDQAPWCLQPQTGPSLLVTLRLEPQPSRSIAARVPRALCLAPGLSVQSLGNWSWDLRLRCEGREGWLEARKGLWGVR